MQKFGLIVAGVLGVVVLIALLFGYIAVSFM